MPTAVETTANADREMIAVRMLDAPRALVWKAWTDPDILKQWWGPNGFTNTFHEFDLRPGGDWRFVMHGPDGKNYDNHNVFVEISPQSRIVMDHIVDPLFRITATFEDLGDKTRLTFSGLFESVAMFDSVKAFAIPGNRQTLDRLAAKLAEMA